MAVMRRARSDSVTPLK